MRKLFPRRSSQADACSNPATGGFMAVASRQPERRGRSRKGTQRHTHLFLFGLAMVALMIFWLANAQLNFMNLLERSGQSRIVDNGPPNMLRPFGAVIRFRPTDLLKKMEEGRRQIDRLRSMERRGVRPPRIALVVGTMNKDCHSLLLLTLVRNLRELGYMFSVFALEDGEALPLWENIHSHVSVLSSDQSILVDWTIFEGVMLSSLEAKRVVSRRVFGSIVMHHIVKLLSAETDLRTKQSSPNSTKLLLHRNRSFVSARTLRSFVSARITPIEALHFVSARNSARQTRLRTQSSLIRSDLRSDEVLPELQLRRIGEIGTGSLHLDSNTASLSSCEDTVLAELRVEVDSPFFANR